MSDIKKIQKAILEFRNERDWKQFDNPKDSAISLALEAAEVLEYFQWKTPEEIEAYLASPKMEELEDELADVLYWVLLMAHDLDFDIVAASLRKIKKSAEKYPVAKARGKHTKHTEL